RVYVAQPELVSGVIRFRPAPLDPRGGVAPRAAASTPDALRVARDSLRPLLIEWVNSAPRSVDAHIALADLLELDGNAIVVGSDRRSSLEELRIARTLPADSVTQLDLMRSQVRLLLKKPDFTAARATADSALRQWRS